jgi:hypothetical protein
MKYRTTNLVGNIEFSTNPEKFCKLLSVRTDLVEQIMFRITEQIKTTCNRLLSFEESIPDSNFNQVILYSEELASYGFISEATEIIDNLRSLISEVYLDHASWFNKAAGDLYWYRFEEFQFEKPEKRKIFLETFDQTNDVIKAVWCLNGTQNDSNPMWHNTAFKVSDLQSFVINKHGISGFIDSVDHTGNHVQTECSNEKYLFIFIQENIERFIKEFIENGKNLIKI